MTSLLHDPPREPGAGALSAPPPGVPLAAALRAHWPEYAIEGAALGAFMVSALVFTVLLEWPGSALHAALPDAALRRALVGVAMGATAIGLVYSPWGQRSGAHMNPALTLTFLRLGKIEPAVALFYVLAQVAGGALGVALAAAALDSMLPGAVSHPSVRFAVTVPGPAGIAAAFAAEAAIAFGLVAVVLEVSNRPRIARATGLCCGALVAAYITFEAPLSGMSMNPARTLASAFSAGVYDAIWLYFAAPLLGMLAAAELHLRRRRAPRVRCAKLDHSPRRPCPFRCGWHDFDPSNPEERP